MLNMYSKPAWKWMDAFLWVKWSNVTSHQFDLSYTAHRIIILPNNWNFQVIFIVGLSIFNFPHLKCICWNFDFYLDFENFIQINFLIQWLVQRCLLHYSVIQIHALSIPFGVLKQTLLLPDEAGRYEAFYGFSRDFIELHIPLVIWHVEHMELYKLNTT